MLQERLKEIDLRITELAEYLQLSRPTVYKFIDMYDKRQFKPIDKRALKVFNFIAENEFAGKRSVVAFILQNLQEDNSDEDGVTRYIRENPDSKKSKFIVDCAESDVYDRVIYYLCDIKPLLNKKKPTAAEKKLLAPFEELMQKLDDTNK